ncbi:hypothetical protein ACW9FF_10675 [Ralstonia mannitolilytica]
MKSADERGLQATSYYFGPTALKAQYATATKTTAAKNAAAFQEALLMAPAVAASFASPLAARIVLPQCLQRVAES